MSATSTRRKRRAGSGAARGPNVIDAAVGQARLMQQKGQYQASRTLLEGIAAQAPQRADVLRLIGLAYLKGGDPAQAETWLAKADALGDVEAAQLLGSALLLQKRFQEGAAALERAVSAAPGKNPPLAELHLAVAKLELGEPDAAAALFETWLASKPEDGDVRAAYAEALVLAGRTLEGAHALEALFASGFDRTPTGRVRRLGRCMPLLRGVADGLVQRFLEACEVRAASEKSPCALVDLGSALGMAGHYAAAEPVLQRAVGLAPDLADARKALIVVLNALGRDVEAAQHYPEVARIQNTALEPYAQAAVRRLAGDLPGAMAIANSALAKNPNDYLLLIEIGTLFQEMEQWDNAFLFYKRAIEIDPSEPAAFIYIGKMLKGLGDTDRSIYYLKRAVQVSPRNQVAINSLVFAMNTSSLVTAEDVAEEVRKAADAYRGVTEFPPPPVARFDPNRKLRIGYVSADFRSHSVVFFFLPHLYWADRENYETYCFHNFKGGDIFTERVRQFCDKFVPCAHMTDTELATTIRSLEIDVLVDMSGFTEGNRFGAFAHRPAPVQATWLGYPSSTGLPAMGYRITDPFMDPHGMTDRLHCETLLRAAWFCYAFDATSYGCPVNTLPASQGKPFTFGSFNNPWKLTGPVLAAWARILRTSPGARLLVANMNSRMMAQRIANEFARHGIDAGRLVFEKRTSLKKLMRLHHHVDLCLDPFPYNGGTTTMNSLYMGVPLVTLSGQSPPARCGLAMLAAAGLTEGFVAEDLETYEALAIGWTRRLDELAALRGKLRARCAAFTETGQKQIVKDFEDLLREAWRRECAKAKAFA